MHRIGGEKGLQEGLCPWGGPGNPMESLASCTRATALMEMSPGLFYLTSVGVWGQFKDSTEQHERADAFRSIDRCTYRA